MAALEGGSHLLTKFSIFLIVVINVFMRGAGFSALELDGAIVSTDSSIKKQIGRWEGCLVAMETDLGNQNAKFRHIFSEF